MNIIYAINTDEYKPLKIDRLGLFKFIGEKRFFELCEVTYPLPEAQEDAICQILEWREINYVSGTDALMVQCIRAMKGINKFTHLKDE